MRTLTLAVSLLALACDGGTSSSDKPDADGFQTVPNISGIKVKVPATAVPNGIGGAAGFHSKDDSFSFILMEDKSADKTLEQAKKDAEELLFKKWIKADKTDDGWVLTYEGTKINEEVEEVGTMYNFEVRRTIGGKTYKCYGGLDKQEGLTAAVDACKSLKAG